MSRPHRTCNPTLNSISFAILDLLSRYWNLCQSHLTCLLLSFTFTLASKGFNFCEKSFCFFFFLWRFKVWKQEKENTGEVSRWFNYSKSDLTSWVNDCFQRNHLGKWTKEVTKWTAIYYAWGIKFHVDACFQHRQGRPMINVVRSGEHSYQFYPSFCSVVPLIFHSLKLPSASRAFRISEITSIRNFLGTIVHIRTLKLLQFCTLIIFELVLKVEASVCKMHRSFELQNVPKFITFFFFLQNCNSLTFSVRIF